MHDRWRAPSGAELFHGLNQRLPQRRMRRAVATFHDLFVLTAEYSTPEFRARFARLAHDAAERSDLIVTVSQFTADQVCELLDVEQERVRVIHHGVHPASADESAREKIVLHVGAIQHRKNIVRLVEAFAKAATDDWRLVLAGSSGYGADEILRHIEASPARSRIELRGFVDDAELRRLYRRASLFAFPSLDEGFGMPVLEAMAAGVPVICSNSSALPEVAGDAAVLVDPYSTEAIATTISLLIADRRLRESLAAKGRQRALQFTWEKAVEKTWSVYKELL
jgi:glycosyltransferase involved in cell wall biosynthesis